MSPVDVAMKEAEEAIAQVLNGTESVQLNPRSSYVRRLQHLMAERFNLTSRSSGREPQRRVEIFRDLRGSVGALYYLREEKVVGRVPRPKLSTGVLGDWHPGGVVP